MTDFDDHIEFTQPDSMGKATKRVLTIVTVLLVIQFFLFVYTCKIMKDMKGMLNYSTSIQTTVELAETETVIEETKQVIKKSEAVVVEPKKVAAISYDFDTVKTQPDVRKGLTVFTGSDNNLDTIVDIRYNEEDRVGKQGLGMNLSYSFAETLEARDKLEQLFGIIFNMSPETKITKDMELKFWIRGSNVGFEPKIKVILMDSNNNSVEVPLAITQYWAYKKLPLKLLGETDVDVEKITKISFAVKRNNLKSKQGAYSIDSFVIG